MFAVEGEKERESGETLEDERHLELTVWQVRPTVEVAG